MIKQPSRAVIGRKSLTRLCRVQFRRRQSKKIKPTQGRFNFLVRAKGMYNSLPKSFQSLGLLVISAGPFHCALSRCVPNPAPLTRLCRVQFRRRQSKKIKPTQGRFNFLVRAKGIEPSSSAWEADVLPLYHARNVCDFIHHQTKSPVLKIKTVEFL